MTQLIRIGHSPDADDAFMFYAMTHGTGGDPGVRIEHVLEDIESLNRRAAGPRSSRSRACVVRHLPGHRGPVSPDGPRCVDGEGLCPIVVRPGVPSRPRAGPSGSFAIPGLRDHRVPPAPARPERPGSVIGWAFRPMIPRVWPRVRPTPASSSTRGRSPTPRMGLLQGARSGWSCGRSGPGLPLPLGVKRDAAGSRARTWPGALSEGAARLHPLRPRQPGRGRGLRAPVAAAASTADTCKRFVHHVRERLTPWHCGEEGRRAARPSTGRPVEARLPATRCRRSDPALGGGGGTGCRAPSRAAAPGTAGP
jgi:hypothetical protein